MRRFVVYLTVVSLLAVACSSGAEPTTTTTTSSTTTTTTSTTTTTTVPPTTTTTIPPIRLKGAGRPLAQLIRSLYEVAEDKGGKDPKAPKGVLAAFAKSDGKPARNGEAAVAQWDENTRLAVVQLGKDVTLAVADPDWRVVGGWWPSLKIGAKLGSFPKVVAVVGSDARPDERRDETRSDSIHFVAMDGKGNAGLIGVPRDSWVPIPGAGTSKINAALSFGGPDMMVDTFTELSGLEFDGYLLTGFAGFEGLVQALGGGIKIEVPRDFHDSAAKADIEAGKQVLDADDALAMSRTRKTLARGDFQRQEHGGLVMMAAQMMLRARGPLALPELLASSRPHVSTNFTPAQLLVLATAITRVKPGKVVNTVLPGGTGSAGGASVVFLNDSASDDMFDDLADGRLEPTD